MTGSIRNFEKLNFTPKSSVFCFSQGQTSKYDRLAHFLLLFQDFLSTVPRLFSAVPVLLVSAQDHCPKTLALSLLSQDYCPKTSVPRLMSQDQRPKTSVPRLMSQDQRPKTSVPRLMSQDHCPKTNGCAILPDDTA